MADAPGAIQAARGAGLSVQDAAQLIDQWEAARPAWDLGGLYWRLTRGTWPERAAEVVRQERRAEDQRQRERQRAELLRERREAEAEAARRRELEDRLGGMLDSLPADELEQLARLVYCDEWRWSYYARNRASPLVREDLLQELERSLEAMA